MNPALTATTPQVFTKPKQTTTYTAPAKAAAKSDAQHILNLVFAVDLVLITVGLISAFLIRFHTPLQEVGYYDVTYPVGAYLGHLIVGVSSLMIVLSNFGFYSADSILSYRKTFGTLWKAASIWLLAYLAVSLILRFKPDISRAYCVLAFAFVLISVGSWRWLFLKFADRTAATKVLHKRILIIGWNESSHNLYGHVASDQRGINEVVGVMPAPGLTGFETAVPSHLVDLSNQEADLHTIFRKYDVDTVVVADLRIAGAELVDLANACEKDMVDFKLIPSGFQIMLSGLNLEHVAGVPVLGISKLPLQSPINTFLKRSVDILGAIVGLLISLPLFAYFGYKIRKESPGPILYRQRRLGRNGKHFTIYKLRSMRQDSEVVGGAQWATQDDPRCLKVGAFMRKWNIDELPQFWNVLKGDMSLVGPRPERPELIQHFKDSIPHYNARHNIMPGMTGWAQVNGLRGNTDLTERVQYDLFYIENWSLALDIQIMASTMLKRENAY